MTKELASPDSDVAQRPDLAESTRGSTNVDAMVIACGGDVESFAQLLGRLEGSQRDAALATAHQRFGNGFVARAMQLTETTGDKDDDTIKVDTSVTLTPAQRAADLLARLTAADAQIARSEMTRLKKFRPKLEAEFKQFCLAYAYDDSKNSRGLFVQYLENANLGAKPKAVSAAQQANSAMQVLFTDIKPGERVPATTIGLREALDPRNELTDEQREKLKSIVLDDGRNGLEARLEAEQLWATKKINLVIDVNAAYVSENPHLAAFTSAARDAGYTQQEIDMVTAGATSAGLWHPVGSKDEAMPATLAEFQKKFGSDRQRGFLLDASRLEDARAALAQGMTLSQLDAARAQEGYDPNFRGKMTNESVTTVVEAYIPMEMRPVVGPMLTDLCSTDHAQRNAASKLLQALIADSKRMSPANAKALRNAIDGLQAQFGMQADPMLGLLRVQLEIAATPVGEIKVEDLTQKPLDPFQPTVDVRTDNQKQGAEMVEKATKQIEQIRDQLRVRQEAGTLDREEASRLYEMMAVLWASYVGDAEKAEHCRMMARMYQSNKEERAEATTRMESKSLMKSEVLVPRSAPDEGTSMRAATEDERELDEIDEQNKEMLAEIEGDMYRKSAEFTPGQPKWVQPQMPATERGERNAERAEAAGGVIYLIKLALEWYAADQNMKRLATRHDRKEELEEKIKRANTERVPPDPAKLRETIAWLTANKHAKMAEKMRLVLDAALAFYDAK